MTDSVKGWQKSKKASAEDLTREGSSGPDELLKRRMPKTTLLITLAIVATLAALVIPNVIGIFRG